MQPAPPSTVRRLVRGVLVAAALLLVVSPINDTGAGAKDPGKQEKGKEVFFDLRVGDARFGVDPDTGEVTIAPMVAIAVEGKHGVPELEFPLEFLYEFEDGGVIVEDQHKAIREVQVSRVCDLACGESNIECSEKFGLRCPPIRVLSMDKEEVIQGRCGMAPREAPDAHERIQRAACACLYWAEAWPVKQTPPRVQPGTTIRITVDPRNVVPERVENNNSVLVVVPSLVRAPR